LETGIFPPLYSESNKGHGRCEFRSIETSTALNGYIRFPYGAQVFRIRRITTDLKGEHYHEEVSYGITSLTPEQADAKRLLQLVRGHWSIENSLHWVRDVTFDEDRSQVRTGGGPQVMATLRNLVISLLRLRGFSSIAKALRYHSRNPGRALQCIGI
jgi:hypothetical protein